MVTPVTSTIWFEIVIMTEPVTPEPSFALAMADTLPFLTAVRSPVLLIVACPVPLTTDQVTVLSVASAGSTTALIWRAPLSVVIADIPPSPVTVIPDTGSIWLEIETKIVPYTSDPSLAVARTVTVPFLIAVKRPVEFIEAAPLSLMIDQVTVLFVASAGRITALS